MTRPGPGRTDPRAQAQQAQMAAAMAGAVDLAAVKARSEAAARAQAAPPPGAGAPAGAGAGEAPPDDPRLDAAEAALDRGDLAAAEAAYRSILEEQPDHPEAGLALRQVQLFRRAEEAGPRALADADAAPDDIAAQTRAADFLLGTGDVDGAFGRLLDVVRRTSGEDRDQARQHLVEL